MIMKDKADENGTPNGEISSKTPDPYGAAAMDENYMLVAFRVQKKSPVKANNFLSSKSNKTIRYSKEYKLSKSQGELVPQKLQPIRSNIDLLRHIS